MRDECALRVRCRMLESVYICPYEIATISGPKLVFIPKFEVGGRVLVSGENARLGRSRKLDAAYVIPYDITRKRTNERNSYSFRNLKKIAKY
jgi:hypothetical protein